MGEKFKSRKFLLAAAAFLSSLGTGITGVCVGNERVAMVGGILCVVSAAIYAACEAYVDGASIKSNTSEYVENIQVTSTTKDENIGKAAAAKIAPKETAPVADTPAPAPVEPAA